MRYIVKLLYCYIATFLIVSNVFAQDSSFYVKKGWSELGKRNFKEVYKITDACIEKYSLAADNLAKGLNNFPQKSEMEKYSLMNDVATCYFIKAEAFMREGKTLKAKRTFREVIEKYPYAQSFDPRGWYWSIKEKSQISLKKLETGKVSEETEEEKVIISKVNLHDKGSEFPVDYSKYGSFSGVGTADYKYVIKDVLGLAKATGEGVYPNTTSVKFDPEFVKIKRKLYKIDHWKILSSRDLSTAFYKWNLAPEPDGVKQFFIGDILERSGEIKQAIKAYYAVLVHFPKTVGWTYWHTPWYIGEAALYRIKYLIKNNPQLGLALEGAEITMKNTYDNDIRNDIIIVNPGKLVAINKQQKIKTKLKQSHLRRELSHPIKIKGEGRVKLVQYSDRSWQLLVDDKPFFIKGLSYSPSRVGESPDEGTLSNWSTQDVNGDGIVDAPFQAWVDKNRNNKKDEDEKAVGDFFLLKEMGVNVLRIYHHPFKINKDVLRKLYKDYGIYVAMGDFLGKYTLGSGADWSVGTDYDNPEDKKKMLESVKEMVKEYANEPYVLFWILGNENVYGLGCNADKKPVSFFKFANEAAKLIKSLDPQKRPVAVGSGDVLYLDIFARYAPDIDIFATNAYRGKYGFFGLWKAVKEVADKPVIITEYGAPSYARGYTEDEAESYQAEYHRNCFLDIYENRAGFGEGNSLGGFAFEWLDEWWKAYEPSYHDHHRLSAGPFLDGYYYEEWFGLAGQGDGKNSPFLRHLKKAYFTYKKMWNKLRIN